MTSHPKIFLNSPNDNIAIRLDRLSKTYKAQGQSNPKNALNDVNLEIPVGCIFGLLGPNGAGKSTLINILAGTVIKSSGSVTVWGEDLDKNPRQCRANIGIVPQELNIDVFLTPYESLEFTAGMYNIPHHERQTKEILEMVELTEQSHAYARTLSGGMRRRMLVAKAMVHSPPILILDEPTAGVDVALRQKLWDSVRSLNDSGVTIVLTTHYLEEAEQLCDHVAILNKGEVMVSKTKADLLKSAGRKDLNVTIPENQRNQPLPNGIEVLNPIITSNGFTIRFNPEKSSSGEILKKIGNAGIQIIDVSTYQPDLEDIFIDLTS